jgi:hypothetical protein
VLDDVRQRLRDDVIGGRLDRLGQALSQAHVERDRHGRAGREHLQRGHEAPLGEDCRMDALRQLAELRQRLGQLLRSDLEQLRRLLGAGADLLEGHPQADRKSHEPLLGAVVQIALEPAPFGVACLDDAKPRRRELLARLRARHREGHERREAGEPAFRLRRQRLVRAQRGDEHTPGHPGDLDRHRDRRAEADLAHAARDLARELRVVDHHRSASSQHLGRG